CGQRRLYPNPRGVALPDAGARRGAKSGLYRLRSDCRRRAGSVEETRAGKKAQAGRKAEPERTDGLTRQSIVAKRGTTKQIRAVLSRAGLVTAKNRLN